MYQNGRYLFFSGKGGVGKTSMAAATAVYLAGEGRRTLIVTTDPASNLADVFEQEIGHRETPIRGQENLWAMEIDPDQATREYKERITGPMRAVLPPEMMQVIDEQLNSPCTAEIAAFDRFVDFIYEPAYEVIVFDTAPTGHTLRLLELPVDWSRHIEESARGAGQTCMGPVQSIQGAKEKYDRAMATLRNPLRTTFVFVVQPEEITIQEAHRSSRELDKLGIRSFELLVNGILPPEEASHPYFGARVRMQERYLKEIATRLPVPTRYMYLLPEEIRGIRALSEVAGWLYGNKARKGGAQEIARPGYYFQDRAR